MQIQPILMSPISSIIASYLIILLTQKISGIEREKIIDDMQIPYCWFIFMYPISVYIGLFCWKSCPFPEFISWRDFHFALFDWAIFIFWAGFLSALIFQKVSIIRKLGLAAINLHFVAIVISSLFGYWLYQQAIG